MPAVHSVSTEEAASIASSANVPPSQSTSDENDYTAVNNKGLVLNALLTAVSETHAGSNGDEYNCLPFVNLFEPSKKCDTLLPGLTIKQQRLMILSTLKAACVTNKIQVKNFFARLRSIMTRIIQDDAYVVDQMDENKKCTDDQDDHDGEPKQHENAKVCLQLLKFAAFCCQAVLDARLIQQQERQQLKEMSVNHQSSHHLMALRMMPQVYEVASDLHEILFSLQACSLPEAVHTRTAILALCESWWLANAENKELLIAQCLPLLVLDATEDADFSKSHIRRLHKLREAFLCIDFSNASSESLRRLILQVASNPLCLRIPEGKKFLASLFHDVDLVKDLHMAFRAQIPQAKKSILQAYGEIYHRAWKEIQDYEDGQTDDIEDSGSMSVRETLEHLVLQDLMHSVIHVSSSATFKAIMIVLEPLHSDKKSKEVASLLHRLYSPILWRSLAAANPAVRRNALVILEATFPLHDPLQLKNNNPMKTAVLKATSALETALNDPDPEVRVTASQTTANICATFWDALPSQEIRSLLNHILLEHSSDATSAAVRAASLEAATTLLGATQSHGVMRALLPSLGNLIHDKTEKVRLAAVRMLIRIKHIPGIRFYHVVPADQLSTRFVEEKTIHRAPRNAVAKELTSLMLNSYFPQGENVSGNSQLKRTITFLLTDPNAAYVFYANLADHLEVESIVKLIRNLQTCLQTAVEGDQATEVKRSRKEKKRRRPQSTTDDTGNDDEADDSEKLSASNTALMASLSQTVDVLWASIVPRLDDISSIRFEKDLEGRFSSKDLIAIVAHFEREGLDCCSSSGSGKDKEIECRRNECFRTCSSLLSCATRRSSQSRKEISSFVSSSLSSISKSRSECVVPLVTSYLAFMCESDHVAEVSTSLAKSIEYSLREDINIFSPTFDESMGARRSRRSNAKKNEATVPTFPSKIAWGVLESILQGVGSEGLSLRNAILSSDPAKARIEDALKKGIGLAERLLGPDSLGMNFSTEEVEGVIHAIDAYGRFALHEQSSVAAKGDCDDSGAVLNSQFLFLIEWTTENVIPVLVGSDDFASHLRDLDVSYIPSANDSLVQVAPGSPTLTSPPKQKPNLGRTPEAMRGSLSSLFERSQHDPPIVFASQFASTLLQYSCLICAEMLAIGRVSARAISKSAIEWSQVLQVPLAEPLVGSFIRLANQLCLTSGDFDLLEELVVKQTKVSSETSFGIDLKMMVNSMLRNGSYNVIDSIVKTYLNSVDRLIDCLDIPFEFDVATSTVEVPGTASTQILLQAIAGHPTATVALGKAVVGKLSENDGDVTNRDVFMATCLSFVARTTNSASAMDRILDDLVPGDFAEGGMRALVEKVLLV